MTPEEAAPGRSRPPSTWSRSWWRASARASSTGSTPGSSSPSSPGTRRRAPRSTTRRTRRRRSASSRRRATRASRCAGSPPASTSSCTRTRWWPSSSSRRWGSWSISRWWTGPRSTIAREKPELWEIFSTGFVFSADPANHVALRCTFNGWWCNEEKERLLADLQSRERPQEAEGHRRPASRPSSTRTWAASSSATTSPWTSRVASCAGDFRTAPRMYFWNSWLAK